MSYGYGGGPDWPMIQARRRAEEAARSAAGQAVAHQASADRWKAAFEALAGQVQAAVGRSGAEHRDGGRCGCPSCWEALITRLATEAQGHRSSAASASSFAFSIDDLFGGTGTQRHP
ncbi:hypothetical protein [Streptomyces sp. bgisy022]|uniref:hypothetical protein n=1 Tax=Streptomyces sp. bgisy022 TaxID=3413769 RepID=UPI003D715126